jgi:GT2 family glycosyltransferase
VFRTLGGFWTRMYAEDEDLAYRVGKIGLRVRFDSTVKVMHVGNHSAGQRWSSAQRAERIAEAELEFLRTHYSRLRVVAIRAIVGIAFAARALVHRALGSDQRANVFRAMSRVYVGDAGAQRKAKRPAR